MCTVQSTDSTVAVCATIGKVGIDSAGTMSMVEPAYADTAVRLRATLTGRNAVSAATGWASDNIAAGSIASKAHSTRLPRRFCAVVDRSGENPPNGDTPPERETQEPSAEPVAPDSDPASDQPANGLQPDAAPDTPYRIGKCRPPRETRFQKGPHGNRKGRRKGSVNLAGLLLKALRRRISVTVGGRPQSMSAQDALIEVTLKRALGGDLRAFNMILRILSEAKMWPEQGDSSRAPTHSTEISAENQAIIDDFVQRFKGG